MLYNKNTHCSYCGALFLEGKFPKSCVTCNNITYLNPLPVSVVLIPCFQYGEIGILTVKRGIEPKLGEWALPGGFIELGETWQEGSIREVKEEIGLTFKVDDLDLLAALNADNGNLLIFSKIKYPLFWEKIEFVPNREVLEINLSFGINDLAFPTHTKIVKKFLNLIS